MNKKLEIVKVIEVKPDKAKVVLVLCFCGGYFTAFQANITNGNTQSCGCKGGK